ncbi:hypothetical protein [Asticcacaulis tiandongensis]|uniref:hypothetical protein n=1 Tax=Asticcacaulis tiandongensis TaxID=2565365 RepID=UPI0011294F3F|nr:hypothetical protein [Asticcacaulis tiandongensis]
MPRRTLTHSLASWLGEWDEDKLRRVLHVTLAVLTGLLAGMVLDTLFRLTGNFIFPPPPTLDMASSEDIRALLDTIPADAYIVKLLGWTLGTFGGGYLAARIARTGGYPAWLTAILLYAGFLLHLLIIPHPNWVVFISIPLCGVAAYLAGLAGMQATMRHLRQQGTI